MSQEFSDLSQARQAEMVITIPTGGIICCHTDHKVTVFGEWTGEYWYEPAVIGGMCLRKYAGFVCGATYEGPLLTDVVELKGGFDSIKTSSLKMRPHSPITLKEWYISKSAIVDKDTFAIDLTDGEVIKRFIRRDGEYITEEIDEALNTKTTEVEWDEVDEKTGGVKHHKEEVPMSERISHYTIY